MKIKHLFLTASLLLPCFIQSVNALPEMPIADAKATLLSRKATPLGKQFKDRRIKDSPTFDKFGIGNYHAQYELDSGKKLMIWMYVERQPPMVDEVVLFVNKATPKDVSHKRAMQLLNLVYSESNAGSSVVKDFEKAIENYHEALKQLKTYKSKQASFQSDKEAQDAYKEFQRATKYYVPVTYNKSLYYMGPRFGYRAAFNKGGFELAIYRKDQFERLIADIQRRLPVLAKAPEPIPSIEPPPPMEETANIDW